MIFTIGLKINTVINRLRVRTLPDRKKRFYFVVAIIAGASVAAFYFFFNYAEQRSHSLIPGDYPDTLNKALPSALDQLKQYPKPDFAVQHPLQPNFLWMDPTYLSGFGQPGVKGIQAVKNSVGIQEQLAAYYHYSLIVTPNSKLFNKFRDTLSFQFAWVNLANEHPEWKAGCISFWAQTQPRHLKDSLCNGDRPLILRKDLPSDYYINFESASTPRERKWNPAQPPEAYRCDWETQRMYFDTMLKYLKRPLHFISENAEVFPLLTNSEVLGNERCKAAMKEQETNDAYIWQAKQRFAVESKYCNAITSLKGLEHVNFSVYSIDGYAKYRHHWPIMRMIQTEQHGMHYATPDFYPRWPYNWRNWSGPWHGLQWVLDARKEEIKTKDHCFSPFVAAGWDKTEAKNIRPGPWLGLLKLMHALGAEYFYTGYFTESKIPNKPEHYIWQAVMPAYAQAALSHTGDFLFNSETLFPENDFLVETDEEDVMFIVRKHKLRPIYLWCITLGRNSNQAGAAQHKTIHFNWKGKNMTCQARIQGSMFYVNEEGDEPVFIQLDRWHEETHPLRWSEFHYADAALWSIFNTSLPIKQSNPAAESIDQLLYSVNLQTGQEMAFQQAPLKGTTKAALTILVSEQPKDALVDLVYKGNIIQTMQLKKGSNRIEFPFPIETFVSDALFLRMKKGNAWITQWMIEQE